MIVGIIAVAAIAVVALSLAGGDDTDPDAVTPAPTSLPASPVQPAKILALPPNILGPQATRLLMWSFDNQSRLQVLDLDSGELTPLGVRGGFALFPLFRNVVVFDGDNGSSVVSAIGATSTEQLGKGVYPVVEREARTLWVLSNDAPRRWQKRAIDGTILDVLPFEANFSVVHYNDHAVLLVSADGTSLFDLNTRQREFLTTTRVFAAAGPNLLGRTCGDRSCTFTVIDIETGRERAFLSDVLLDEASTATVSPDGDLLAISRTSAFGRRAEIVRVSSGATQWQSPDIVVSSTAWSWSPDSRWLFVETSAEVVSVVDMRAPWVQAEIPLSRMPLHGLAVTYR
ncbi:MAG: hypothetical protein ABIQ73_16660 [Acidimicrobiales bacterium]